MMANGNMDYAKPHNNQLRGSGKDASKGDKEGEGECGKGDGNGGY